MALLSDYFEPIGNGKVKCKSCSIGCELSPGGTGRCKIYTNRAEKLWYETDSPSTVSVSTTHEESFFHIFPGAKLVVFSTASCNFTCPYCFNFPYSTHMFKNLGCSLNEIEDCGPSVSNTMHMDPEDLPYIMTLKGAQALLFAITEPCIIPTTLLKWCKVASENNIPVLVNTNGYSTPETLEALMPYVDGWTIDIKGDDDMYKKILKLPLGIKPVLDNVETLLRNAKHVELIIPIWDLNGDKTIFTDILGPIAAINPYTPVHVKKTIPVANREEVADSLVQEMSVAIVDIGFKYVYNNISPENQITYCLKCQAPLYQRTYDGTFRNCGVCETHCSSCDHETGIKPLK